MSAMSDAARRYQDRGWRVVPLHRVGGRMKMCTCRDGGRCKSAGKHPIERSWTERIEPLTDEEIEHLWGGDKPWNLGILTGTPSGFWAMDIDQKNGGMESARRLAQVTGPLRTRIVQTGSGGFHYLFSMPTDVGITNANARLKRDYPGIDIRGTGGLVVAPPSVTDKGPYLLRPRPGDVDPAEAPQVLIDLVRHVPVEVQPGATREPIDGDGESDRVQRYALGMLESLGAELRALHGLAPGEVDAKGRGWEKATADVAQRLGQLVRADWCRVDAATALDVLLVNAPRDAGWTLGDVETKWEQQRDRGAPAPYPPAPPPPQSEDPLLPGYVAPRRPARGPVGGEGESPPPAPGEREPLCVDNPATMLDWLQANMGKGRLGGLYLRGSEVVHVPGTGEDGYQPISEAEGDSDGPAQVRPLSARGLVGKVHFSYRTYVNVQSDKGGKYEKHSLFPTEPAAIAIASPQHMHNIPLLRRVAHAPIVRSDGSILSEPGYDSSTGVLYRPDPTLKIPSVPEHPTSHDLAEARRTLNLMLHDFRFETPSDRLSYLGMLLTPLLRAFAPAPYKMCLIEAAQPGSGKTFLARVLMTLHGGVFRSEMPRDEGEMNKVVTAILDVTTSPVVIFDNATGVVRSSTMAGLLTSGRWEERRLGTGSMVTASNDRLWVITGNNVSISGDLARRTLRARIDAGVPHPERRVNFKIPDFESWVRDNRGSLLWSLLVLIRHWFCEGRPDGQPRGADVYRRWSNTVDGILRAAGATQGTFDDATLVTGSDVEEIEWGQFLHSIYQVKGESFWTAREVLLLVNESSLAMEWIGAPRPISFESVPSDLLAKRRPNQPLDQLSKSLGWWLANREGRWAAWLDTNYRVSSQPTKDGKIWKISRHTT